MAIWQTDVIDFIGINSGNELCLTMTDHLEFLAEYDYKHLIQIQKKLNHYLAFIESGQYKDHYADNKIEKFVIEMRFLFEPSKTAQEFFEYVRRSFDSLEYQIELKVTVSDDEDRQKYDVKCSEADYDFDRYEKQDH